MLLTFNHSICSQKHSQKSKLIQICPMLSSKVNEKESGCANEREISMLVRHVTTLCSKLLNCVPTAANMAWEMTIQDPASGNQVKIGQTAEWHGDVYFCLSISGNIPQLEIKSLIDSGVNHTKFTTKMSSFMGFLLISLFFITFLLPRNQVSLPDPGGGLYKCFSSCKSLYQKDFWMILWHWIVIYWKSLHQVCFTVFLIKQMLSLLEKHFKILSDTDFDRFLTFWPICMILYKFNISSSGGGL